jgi:hypothetical protein
LVSVLVSGFDFPRDTIFALYETFTTARRTSTPWQSPLNPPPGQT